MPKKTISPRITPRAKRFLQKFFQAQTTGAGYILDAIPLLFDQAMAQIAGVFDQDELETIIDAFSPDNPGLAPAAAGAQIERIMEGRIRDKAELLTSWEKVCLEIWAAGFHHDTMSYEKTLEKWCKGMC